MINILSRVLQYLSAVSMSVITILLTINVFLRYVLNRPISWAEEISVLMMVWLIFLGAGLLQEKDEHVAISFVFDLFPNQWKKVTIVFGQVCVCIVLIIHFVSALKLAMLQLTTYTPALRFSMIYFALAVVVGMMALLVFTVDSTIKRFMKG